MRRECYDSMMLDTGMNTTSVTFLELGCHSDPAWAVIGKDAKIYMPSITAPLASLARLAISPLCKARGDETIVSAAPRTFAPLSSGRRYDPTAAHRPLLYFRSWRVGERTRVSQL